VQAGRRPSLHFRGLLGLHSTAIQFSTDLS
jgi:hypothetical protein